MRNGKLARWPCIPTKSKPASHSASHATHHAFAQKPPIGRDQKTVHQTLIYSADARVFVVVWCFPRDVEELVGRVSSAVLIQPSKKQTTKKTHFANEPPPASPNPSIHLSIHSFIYAFTYFPIPNPFFINKKKSHIMKSINTTLWGKTNKKNKNVIV
jgi:hypothetical protein